MARIKRNRLGFQQAFEYLLDLFCYSYYVKHTHFVSDHTFDDLEKFYCKTFKVKYAPKRSEENADNYSNGIRFIYEFLKKGHN